MTTPPTRIVVLDDHRLFSETLTFALAQAGYDARTVATPPSGGSGSALVRTIVAARPAVALLDLNLGAFGSALPLIRPLVAADVRVVVITSSPRSEWGESLVHGASLVVAKTTALHEILAQVRSILQGQTVLAPEERAQLLHEWDENTSAQSGVRARLAELSTREQEVLARLMAGRTVQDIARESVVSTATVRTQIRAILGKLEVSSQLAAVVLATQAGWRRDGQ